MELDRRSFLARGAAATGGAVLAAAAFDTAAGAATPPRTRPDPQTDPDSYTGGYGPLRPVVAANDPGVEYFALPAGFSYVVFGKTGTPMVSDPSLRNPRSHDGMAAFDGNSWFVAERGDGPGRTVRLTRNHEDRNAPGAGTVGGPGQTRYDPLAGGGVTVLDYDPRTRAIVRDHIGVNGTHVNCAGGIAWRRQGWLTCEETIVGPEAGYGRRHGYVFLVPIGARDTVPARPLTAMGRFSHEAVATDQRTGVVYLTEDAGSGRGSGFYRFLPRDPARLERGGRLQILMIEGRPQTDLREGQTERRWLPVTWRDIDDPDPEPVVEAELPGATSVFAQGWAAGGAKFNRLEGIWAAERSFFIASTSGGDAKNGDVNSDGFAEGYGQIWEYEPSRHGDGRLRLVFESPGGSVLDSPDNLTVTPRGNLLLCEDDAGSADGDEHPLAPGLTDVNRLIGLTRAGRTFEFLVNRFSTSELAGACFSPDGQTLFVNVFGTAAEGSGFTAAITGPWRRGVL
jgi:secreted PhoX family phosphatase